MNQKKLKNNFDKGEEKSSPLKLQRKCISCGLISERENFIRVLVENGTKNLFINPDSKTFGRSAYLCKNEECLKKALKKNLLNRNLKTQISENILEKLKMMIN